MSLEHVQREVTAFIIEHPWFVGDAVTALCQAWNGQAVLPTLLRVLQDDRYPVSAREEAAVALTRFADDPRVDAALAQTLRSARSSIFQDAAPDSLDGAAVIDALCARRSVLGPRLLQVVTNFLDAAFRERQSAEGAEESAQLLRLVSKHSALPHVWGLVVRGLDDGDDRVFQAAARVVAEAHPRLRSTIPRSTWERYVPAYGLPRRAELSSGHAV